VRSDARSFETSDARNDVKSNEMSDGRSDEVSFRVSVLGYFPVNSEMSFLTSFEGSLEEKDKGIERSKDRVTDGGHYLSSLV
jgi:hypothetical protein